MRFLRTAWVPHIACWVLLAACTLGKAWLYGQETVEPAGPAQSAESAPVPATLPVTPTDAPIPASALTPSPQLFPEAPPQEAKSRPATVWGLAGLRGFVLGQEVAPNGLEYNQLFTLDMNFNLMLWQEQRVYLFADARFWAQKPGAGITNQSQGVFDFSKREFDFNVGAAWNYYGNLEFRTFAYSDNNLNRGVSEGRPTGYTDGVGLEQRYYLGRTYADLGTEAFDVARATFVSLGYYPTKDMVDGLGLDFKPGPFARAYLTCDLHEDRYYLYLDTQLIGERSFLLKLFLIDGGLAFRPFEHNPRLEFRVGSEDTWDIRWGEWDTSLYGAIRYVY